MIVIIDYGLGNLGSIKNMLSRIGVESIISSNPEMIKDADKLILPGVGSFDQGMENLGRDGLIDLLTMKVIHQNTPILGICLGMQLFAEASEEGDRFGLGWIPAKMVKFSKDQNSGLKVPHMGWNTIELKKDHDIFKNIKERQRFYFVHSYYMTCDPKYTVAQTTYGSPFVSVVAKDNIIGVQFHPEKSHKFGMNFFSRFIESL